MPTEPGRLGSLRSTAAPPFPPFRSRGLSGGGIEAAAKALRQWKVRQRRQSLFAVRGAEVNHLRSAHGWQGGVLRVCWPSAAGR